MLRETAFAGFWRARNLRATSAYMRSISATLAPASCSGCWAPNVTRRWRRNLLQAIRRQRGKASVLDWATHREMVEALPIARRDAEHLVNRIIEVAADPGR